MVAERERMHLEAVESESGEPVSVISSLDVAWSVDRSAAISLMNVAGVLAQRLPCPFAALSAGIVLALGGCGGSSTKPTHASTGSQSTTAAGASASQPALGAAPRSPGSA